MGHRITHHVLIADDHPDAAESLAEMLTLLSPMEVTTDVATDGAQALAFALTHPPQVAVLDIDMPIMSGIDAAHAIRSALGISAPFLVALTGNRYHFPVPGDTGPFDRVLLKPIDIDELVDVLAGHLRITRSGS